MINKNPNEIRMKNLPKRFLENCCSGLFSIFFVSIVYTNKKMPKNAEQFNCVDCSFVCSKKSNWDKHLSTRKHKILTDTTEKVPIDKTYTCVCSKHYKHKSSLCNHQKTCSEINNLKNTFIVAQNDQTIDPYYAGYDSDTSHHENDEDPISSLEQYELNKKKYNNPNINEHLSLITELLKQNQELQKQILEISKEGRNYISNTTNNNSKHFNLNVFLNEKCKDAVNLMDFVNSLQVQLSEFEATGRLGYVEGISQIVINRLKTMEVRKRPIHCTDSKRETMYIKDDDTWEKEDSNRPKLAKALKIVADKNFQKMIEWQQVYPECVVNNTKENDYFFKIISSALGGNTPEEDAKNQDKIIRNIAREVVIDKDM